MTNDKAATAAARIVLSPAGAEPRFRLQTLPPWVLKFQDNRARNSSQRGASQRSELGSRAAVTMRMVRALSCAKQVDGRGLA